MSVTDKMNKNGVQIEYEIRGGYISYRVFNNSESPKEIKIIIPWEEKLKKEPTGDTSLHSSYNGKTKTGERKLRITVSPNETKNRTMRKIPTSSLTNLPDVPPNNQRDEFNITGDINVNISQLL